jgi:3,4-dihydroxy 2-butanone 4-phosphate synthase/GTP cyclohydrolase II
LIGYGLEIIDNIALEVGHNKYNDTYLRTKRDKMGHSLHLDNENND